MATASGTTPAKEVRLDLEGMTCASCVARIERRLNTLDGVEATVNFATEQATVRCAPSVNTEDLVQALGDRTIAGAALDVFEGEPTLPLALRDLANLVVTPHMAGRSPASDAAQIDALINNLAAASAGGALTAQLA